MIIANIHSAKFAIYIPRSPLECVRSCHGILRIQRLRCSADPALTSIEHSAFYGWTCFLTPDILKHVMAFS